LRRDRRLGRSCDAELHSHVEPDRRPNQHADRHASDAADPDRHADADADQEALPLGADRERLQQFR